MQLLSDRVVAANVEVPIVRWSAISGLRPDACSVVHLHVSRKFFYLGNGLSIGLSRFLSLLGPLRTM